MTSEAITGVLSFSAAFIVTQAWNYIRNRSDSDKQELKQSIKDNTKALQELTLQMQRLELELEHLTERTDRIPVIEKDLNSLGAKVRGSV